MPWSPFEHMKGKYAKRDLSWMHFMQLLTVMISRIKLSGFPDNILSTDTMLYLCSNGTVGCAKFDDGNYWTFPGCYTGQFWGQTVPHEYMGVLPNVGDVRGIAGEKIAVGWNNSTHTPDFILMQTADILADIDVSEHVNVLFARYMRIPKVHDEKERKAVLDSIKSIMRGNVEAIVSKNINREEILTGSPAEPFLDLTDVDKIDKLQYLDQYYKAVMRRFYEYAGQKVSVGPKMAQMSVKEAGANDSLSMILLMDHFEHVKKFCDECNRLFGWDTKAELTECFADELQEMREEAVADGGESLQDKGDQLGGAGTGNGDSDSPTGDSAGN